MVDVWPKANEGAQIAAAGGVSARAMMFHGNETETRLAMAGGKPQSMSDGFVAVKQFLEANPTEVVTILFESYIDDPAVIPAALREAGVEQLVFWCDGRDGIWNVLEKGGWPTLNEMITMGKRLVLMSSRAAVRFIMWKTNRGGRFALGVQLCRGESLWRQVHGQKCLAFEQT
jgi:hypothetical protein